MSRRPFDPEFEALPDRLAVFPLPGVLLLPGSRLPLNIFEPRYLKMFDDALSSSRLIGMIQPLEDETGVEPTLYRTGCTGRITAFSETDDGRYLVTLTGLIRFHVTEELDPRGRGPQRYRVVRPDMTPFRADLDSGDVPIDRAALQTTLRGYFAAKALEVDWDSIEKADDEALVNTLSMACPLSAPEKQMLLEAADTARRVEVLTAIMEMAIHAPGEGAPRH